jgi:hypothetical protein
MPLAQALHGHEVERAFTMPRLSHRFAAAASVTVLALACSAPAFADDSGDPGELPALPKPASEDAPARSDAPAKDDIPVVQARVVKTNRVDTVVVAQAGSQVTVSPRSHREYAPDPGRKAAIIASPIVFGVGGAVAGIAYLTARGSSTTSCPVTDNSNNQWQNNCTTDNNNGTAALWTYNIIVAGVPSAPRWVVGDVMGAVVYTGLRTASVVAASTIQWGSDTSAWIGPFMLGFLAPVTLGIVDLATTPHREDLRPHDPQHDDPEAKAQTGFHIASIAPITLTDPEHKVNGAMLTVGATF